MSKATIFLIEEDDDTRPLFRKLLKKQGYSLALAIDREDALERVTHGEFKVDLMIVNLCDTSAEGMLDFGRGISREAHLNIPIIAMVADFGADLEGQNIRVSESEYIVYLEEADQLFDLMDDLLTENIAA